MGNPRWHRRKEWKGYRVLNEEQEQKYIENTEEVNEMYKDEESSE